MVSEVADLRTDLELYRSTAARLEEAYSELCAHARRVDQELKDKNQKLASTLTEMDSVLKSLPLAVFRDRDGGAVPVNPRAHELVEQHGVIDRLADLETTPTQLESIGSDGVKRCFEGRRVSSDDGELYFVEDRTPWLRMESELERLERLGSLAEIALGIAHEIRNPLNGLAGFASLLRRSPESPRVAEWAAHIEHGAKRVECTVRDLLDFARPDRRREPLRLTLGNWLHLAGEELPVEIDDELAAVELVAASRTLDQAFANLTRNSREAGATRLRVVRVEDHTDRLCLRFSDDGPGLDDTIIDKVFDPFVGTKEEGSGLGLAFVSRVFSQIGGVIRVATGAHEDDLVGGACFEIELPLPHAAGTTEE